MDTILRKLKLIENFNTELEIEKGEFIEKLRLQVDPSGLGLFSNLEDLFSSSKNDFKGYVGRDYFEIKKKKRFFDMNNNFSIVKGTCTQNGNKLIVNAEIKGFNKALIPFLIIIPIFYLLIITIFLILYIVDNDVPLFILPFILFHGLFMIGIPYFIYRRSVKNMAKELEKEFFYLTKK